MDRREIVKVGEADRAHAPDHALVEQIRVIVADDHRAFADAMAIRLAFEDDITVVTSATTVEAAVRLSRALEPDVLLVDFSFDDGSGVDVVTELSATAPDVHVVIVTGHDDLATCVAAARAGAYGFVSKHQGLPDVLDAVRLAASGSSLFPPALLRGVFAELLTPAPDADPAPLASLSPREREVLDGMVRGLSRDAIARELFLSTNTVRTHMRNLMAKLGVHSSLEAVVIVLGDRSGERSAAISRR